MAVGEDIVLSESLMRQAYENAGLTWRGATHRNAERYL